LNLAKSTFRWDQRKDYYDHLTNKDVALVRLEYNYVKDYKVRLARRYAWLTREQLISLYDDATGHLREMYSYRTKHSVSMHETFLESRPVLFMLDLDDIPHDQVEHVRKKLELKLVTFWNEKFPSSMHRITVANVLWQDSSRYENGALREKGASLVLIVTDLKRCLQFR